MLKPQVFELAVDTYVGNQWSIISPYWQAPTRINGSVCLYYHFGLEMSMDGIISLALFTSPSPPPFPSPSPLLGRGSNASSRPWAWTPLMCPASFCTAPAVPWMRGLTRERPSWRWPQQRTLTMLWHGQWQVSSKYYYMYVFNRAYSTALHTHTHTPFLCILIFCTVSQ